MRCSRIPCAWSRLPCGSELAPSAAQADHGALWCSCWSSVVIAVGHAGMKYCLVLSAVLIAGLSSYCTAARLLSSVPSATTIEDSETERRHDVTSPKLFHQMFLHTQGNLSHRSGHMDPSLVSEIARRLRQHRGHHNAAKKEKEGTVPQPTQHRLCATLWQHGKHFQLFVRD